MELYEMYEKAITLWQSYSIHTTADLDKYLDNFRILFAYHSGRIENENITYHDTREIFENGRVQGFTGSPRALFEQQNQKLCYEYLKEKIVEKESVSLALIKEIHRILTSGTYDERRYIVNEERPGEFKKHDYVTGIHEVGSDAEDVEDDLNDLLEEISSFESGDILKASVYLHAMFEYIHPFAAGNRRVGRTLMNYFLMIHDYPPIIVYEEDKQEYYAALLKFDEEEELDSLYVFMKNQGGKTWNRTLEMAEGIKRKRKGFEEICRETE